jgi:hypothetical protein
LEIKGSKKFPINEVIPKLSKVIVDWNVNKVYNQKKNNCQQFIDELCKELGFDLSAFKGPFGDFIDEIRSKGKCQISFPLKGEMREIAKSNESFITFKSHAEIDEFVYNLLKEKSEFFEDYPLETNVKFF